MDADAPSTERFTLRPRGRTHFPHLTWAAPVAALLFLAGALGQPFSWVAGLVVLLLGLRPAPSHPVVRIDLDAEQVRVYEGALFRRETRRFPLHRFRTVRLSMNSLFADIEVSDGPVGLHWLGMPSDQGLDAARTLARALRATLVLPDGTEEPFDASLPPVATDVRWPLVGGRGAVAKAR